MGVIFFIVVYLWIPFIVWLALACSGWLADRICGTACDGSPATAKVARV
jgi:hypothetical protein